MRTISEIEVYTRTDLEQLAKFAAKAKIIGGFYKGDFVNQTVEWKDDGSVMIITKHVQENG